MANILNENSNKALQTIRFDTKNDELDFNKDFDLQGKLIKNVGHPQESGDVINLETLNSRLAFLSDGFDNTLNINYHPKDHLDTELFRVETIASTNQTAINDIRADIDSLGDDLDNETQNRRNDITQLSDELNTLQSEIDTLEAQATQHESEITALENRTNITEVGLESIEAITSIHTTKISDLEALTTGHTTDINDLEALTSIHTTKISNLEAPTIQQKFSPILGDKINLYDGGSNNYKIGVASDETYITTANKFYVYRGNREDQHIQISTDHLDNVIIQNGSLFMNTHQIKNVGNPTQPKDVATMDYVDTEINNVKGITDTNTEQINSLQTIIENQDVATKSYVDTAIQNVGGTSDTLTEMEHITFKPELATKIFLYGDAVSENYTIGIEHNTMVLRTGDVFKICHKDDSTSLETNTNSVIISKVLDMNMKRITKVATPSAPTDAINKEYLDNYFDIITNHISDTTPLIPPSPYPASNFYPMANWLLGYLIKANVDYLVEVNATLLSYNHASSERIGAKIEWSINTPVGIQSSHFQYNQCTATGRATNQTTTNFNLSTIIPAYGSNPRILAYIRLACDTFNKPVSIVNATFKLSQAYL